MLKEWTLFLENLAIILWLSSAVCLLLKTAGNRKLRLNNREIAERLYIAHYAILRYVSTASIVGAVINVLMVSITIARLNFLPQLIIEAAVGIAVIVRVFVDKKSMETEIVNRLGNSFSRAPLAAVVGLCTVVTIPACYQLGELLFFHMLLIKKGITTYDYVVAMRAMSEAPDGASVDEEIQNVLYSPTGSATTGFSGGSSLGLPYKTGVWCTPPRVFDNKDEALPHLDTHMVSSTVDPDAAERGIKAPKRSVKRNAWKLAKLDANEAARAAARARASSSVLRPIDNHHLPDNALSSIGTVSINSCVSTCKCGCKERDTEQ